jgi:hypothetical protein
MWTEFLRRLVESFAAVNPDAYLYYHCCKQMSLTGSETHRVRSSLNTVLIALRQASPTRKEVPGMKDSHLTPRNLVLQRRCQEYSTSPMPTVTRCGRASARPNAPLPASSNSCCLTFEPGWTSLTAAVPSNFGSIASGGN